MAVSGLYTGGPPQPLPGEQVQENYATPEQRERFARLQAWKDSLPAVEHPGAIEARRAAEVEQQEAARKAAGDPRIGLKVAHAVLRDARGEVGHRKQALARAEAHLAEQQQAAAEVDRADSQAVAGMLTAFRRGEAVASPEPADRDAVDVTLATRARDALAVEVAGAEKAELIALRQVEQAAVAVIVDAGMHVVSEIDVVAAEMARLRAKLAGIDRLWVMGKAIPLPPPLAAALGGVSGDTGRWDGAYKALLADAEAVIG